jgi:hypothetical protein
MSKAFYYKSSNRQTIDNVDQVIGRLALPPGNYIIIGEGSVAPTKLNGIIDLNQAIECKLKAGSVEDKIKLNLWGYGLTSDIIALNIGVRFDGGIAELTCTSGNPGSASVFDIALSAIQVDELQPGEEIHPSAQHKLALYAKLQDRAFAPFAINPNR